MYMHVEVAASVAVAVGVGVGVGAGVGAVSGPGMRYSGSEGCCNPAALAATLRASLQP